MVQPTNAIVDPDLELFLRAKFRRCLKLPFSLNSGSVSLRNFDLSRASFLTLSGLSSFHLVDRSSLISLF